MFKAGPRTTVGHVGSIIYGMGRLILILTCATSKDRTPTLVCLGRGDRPHLFFFRAEIPPLRFVEADLRSKIANKVLEVEPCLLLRSGCGCYSH